MKNVSVTKFLHKLRQIRITIFVLFSWPHGNAERDYPIGN